MKRQNPILICLLILALSLTLAACSGTSERHDPPTDSPTPEVVLDDLSPDPTPDTKPDQTEPPETSPAADPTPDSSSPEPTPTATPTPAVTTVTEDPKAVAQGLVGSDVSSLYAAVGYPVSSSYAPSCLGDGEDGELVYDGFTVYTYRENGAETIETVL